MPLNSDHLGLIPAPSLPTCQLQKFQASPHRGNAAQRALVAIPPDFGLKDPIREHESAREEAVSPAPGPAGNKEGIIPSSLINPHRLPRTSSPSISSAHKETGPFQSRVVRAAAGSSRSCQTPRVSWCGRRGVPARSCPVGSPSLGTTCWHLPLISEAPAALFLLLPLPPLSLLCPPPAHPAACGSCIWKGSQQMTWQHA